MKKKGGVTFEKLNKKLLDIYLKWRHLDPELLTLDDRKDLYIGADIIKDVCAEKIKSFWKAKRRKRKKKFLKKFFGK